MKVIESQGISSFGGLNFVIQELDRKKIGHLLNEYLPELKSQSIYDWREIVYSFWSVFFCGGTCIEDLSINLRKGFKNNPLMKLPVRADLQSVKFSVKEKRNFSPLRENTLRSSFLLAQDKFNPAVIYRK